SSMTKVIEYSNQAYELFGQIAELRKTVPCPLPGRLLAMNAVALGMTGSSQLVDFLKAQRDVGREKVRRKEGYLPEEKMRVAWIQNPIFFDFGVMDWMEKEYGAMVTMDAFGFRKDVPIKDTSDKAKVFKGLAKRSLMTPMTHVGSSPVEYWMESTAEILRDYKCNAAIFAGHVGCSHNWAVGKLIKDMISDKFGITTLVFDVDALDPRYASSETIKDRIRNFMEIIQ
ncbi:MAG: 2-hydroxyacyl-CoA dehydratase, partial [Deltaproteobacteria bacterium]|nr:2-hydroxyacyl-CoA dehydratase [Deltaproteobacteria bacterium]